jgi:putative SbcD/Mre11-related phosphoesterase
MRDQIALATGIIATGFGAIFLPDIHTAIIADVHIGYARAARRRGGYLPSVESVDTLIDRTQHMLHTLKATTLVIAGDLRHSTHDVDDVEQTDVEKFINTIAQRTRIHFVAGNHDRGSTAPHTLSLGDIDIMHEPPTAMPARRTIAGHLHPSTTVRDETGAGARYPCFLTAGTLYIIPAFTEWAGGTKISRLRPQLPEANWHRIVLSNGLLYEL